MAVSIFCGMSPKYSQVVIKDSLRILYGIGAYGKSQAQAYANFTLGVGSTSAM